MRHVVSGRSRLHPFRAAPRVSLLPLVVALALVLVLVLPLLAMGQANSTPPTTTPPALPTPPSLPPKPPGTLPGAPPAPGTVVPPEQPVVEPGTEIPPVPEGELLPPEEEAEEEREVLPLFGHDIFAEAALAEPPLLETIPAPPPTYVLGPGDEVELRVWGRGIDYVPPAVEAITNDGAIFGPTVGRIPLAGKTIAEAREGILASYRRYYPECDVSLTIARLRSIEVMVLGDVVRPGRRILPGTSTLFTALYAAGGPLESGALRDIDVRRGTELVAQIDLYDLLLRGDTPDDLGLRGGDTVFVHVIGAVVAVQGEVRRPARYEIGAGATLAEALDMAGGIRGSAFAQRIQVLRPEQHRERIVVEADLVNEPEKWRAVELQDGDEINVLPVLEDVRNAVTVEGAVRRPGAYAWAEGMTVTDAIDIAEGITPDGAPRTVQILRESEQGSRDLVTADVAAIRAGTAENIPVQPRDIVRVSDLTEVAPSLVYVEGAVNLPGEKEFYRGMTVGGLIRAGGGLTTGAYGDAATLVRKNEAFEDVYVAVPIGRIMSGMAEHDVPLQVYDRLIVLAREEKGREKLVEIAGAVADPAEYPVGAGMRLSDLIRIAGGLRPEASGQVTILRGQATGSPEAQEVDASALLAGQPLEPDPMLQEGDTISVEGRGTFLVEAQFAEVKGRVATPAAYPLVDPDGSTLRVSDLLAAAGGLLSDAYPEMAVVYQTDKSMAARADRVSTVKTALHDSTTLPPKEGEEEVETADGEAAAPETPPAPAQATTLQTNRRIRATGLAKQLYEVIQGVQGEAHIIIPPRALGDIPISNGVPVDLTRVLRQPHGPADIELQDGDILTVFSKPATVMVDGAVAGPGPHPFIERRTVRDYLYEAGQFTRDADRSHVVVVHYNGHAVRAQMDQRVQAGDWILVPTRYVTQTVGRPSSFQQTLNSLLEAVGAFLLFRKL